MKERIIKQMTEVVRDVMTNFQSDFYKYDMEALENYDERFLWFVAPSHTHLAKIGEQYLSDIVDLSEEGLYAVLQRNTTPDACVNSLSKDDLVFYYDGDQMTQITIEEAKHLWEAVRSWSLYSWQLQNGMCALPNDFTIPLELSCSFAYLKDQLKYAREIGTSTLVDALKRFKHYQKINSTHKCVIGKDFSQHSFTFAFIYTDSKTGEEKCSLNGGLLYYDGKWNTHT